MLPTLEIFKPKVESETRTFTQLDKSGLVESDGRELLFKLTLRTHSVTPTKLSYHLRLPPNRPSLHNKLLRPLTLPALHPTTAPMELLPNPMKTKFPLLEISNPPEVFFTKDSHGSKKPLSSKLRITKPTLNSLRVKLLLPVSQPPNKLSRPRRPLMSKPEMIKTQSNASILEPKSLLPTKLDSSLSMLTFKWFTSQSKTSSSDSIEELCSALSSDPQFINI